MFEGIGKAYVTAIVDIDRKVGFEFKEIEPKFNLTQSSINRSIGFDNRTKSYIYFAASSIVKPIERNRTQYDSILFGIHLFIMAPENK